MVTETQRYYDNVTSTLDPGLLHQYEAQIKNAKATRMENPEAMDIMASNSLLQFHLDLLLRTPLC